MKKPLGELLVEMGVVNAAQVSEALSFQRNRQMKLGEALVALGHADEASVAKALARQHDLPFVDLEKGKIARSVLERVPAQVAKEYGVVPLLERQGKLVVAVDDPLKTFLADNLRFLLQTEVECALAAPGALKKALLAHYGGDGAAPAKAPDGSDLASASADAEADAPIIRLVRRTIEQALEERASDVHVEPFANRVRIRYRIDGVLKEVDSHPKHLQAPLISRLKIMAGMDIAERRKPQDGRIGLRVQGRDIDIRASILPGSHGEAVVLRLLDREASLIGLAELGFDGEDYKWFRRMIRKPNGIILVTGPTGSGKTTTLYAALQELNRPDVKIITAEDPVEYHIKGINQVQVKAQVGLSFARILRAMLRQAPNIILVGEIRDTETAEIAIQAALTGHLVFSTLHTNDATSAIIRLVDMGVKPFLVSSSLQSVIAQRLVRTICPDCREPYTPEPSELRSVGLSPERVEGKAFFRGRGCPRCGGTGYRGRKGIFEVLELDTALRELVYRNAPAQQVRDQARGSGRLSTLLQDGVRKVLAGQTTIPEVLRVAFEGPAEGGEEATEAFFERERRTET